MYPVLFRISSFDITSFGVMLAVAAVASLRLFDRELRRSSLPPPTIDAALYGLFGGIVGAKVVWAVEHAASGSIASLVFARGGLSWYGGLLGGLIVGMGVLVLRRLPLMAVLSAATPAFAFGHALGRIGCFLVGDDYGVPSELPWAVAFPEGMPPTTVPVHPTQLYEAIGLSVLGVLLIQWRKAGLPHHLVLGRYLILAGALRFAVESIRVHEPIILGLAVAHLFSLVMIVAGLAVIRLNRGASNTSRG